MSIEGTPPRGGDSGTHGSSGEGTDPRWVAGEIKRLYFETTVETLAADLERARELSRLVPDDDGPVRLRIDRYLRAFPRLGETLGVDGNGRRG